MRVKIGNADGVFKQRNNGLKLFTEPDLNTMVLPFLGILPPPPHPRFINNKKKRKFLKLWWGKN
jgi:hypothetical protein